MNLFPKRKPDTGFYEVRWDPQAEELLRRDGNFVLKAVQEEFKQDPNKGAYPIDDSQYYLTPVANRRYSVIWKVNAIAGKPIAKVSAVVPLRFAQVAEGGMTLKERVRTAVMRESGGQVQLDF